MQGLCVGCDREGSLKAVNAHIGRCPEYAKRFQAGEELLDPAEAYRQRGAQRRAAPAARPVSPSRPEVSVPVATVAAPQRISRRAPAVGASERVAGPVSVEVWDVPSSF
jgi:hypothetical protein